MRILLLCISKHKFIHILKKNRLWSIKAFFAIPENFLVSGGDTSFLSCFNELALSSCCDNVSNRYLIYWPAEKSLSKKMSMFSISRVASGNQCRFWLSVRLFEMVGEHWSVAGRVIARSSRQIPLKIDSLDVGNFLLKFSSFFQSTFEIPQSSHQFGKVIELKNIFKLALECSSHLWCYKELASRNVPKIPKYIFFLFRSHFGLWVGHSVWRSQFAHFHWKMLSVWYL